MRRLARTALVLVAIVVTGCATNPFSAPLPTTPEETLAAAEITFQEQASAIIEMVNAGLIDDDRLDKAGKMIATSHAALVTARAAVANLDSPAPFLDALQSAMVELIAYVKAERARSGAPT